MIIGINLEAFFGTFAKFYRSRCSHRSLFNLTKSLEKFSQS